VNEPLVAALARSAGQSAATIEEVLRGVDGAEREQLAALCASGLLTEAEAYRAWADSLGMEFHALEERQLDPALLRRLPLDVAKRYGAVAVGLEDGLLDVVLQNPFDILAVDAIQEVTGHPVQVVMAPPSAIERALARLERSLSGIEGLIARIQKSEIDLSTVDDADKLRRVVGEDAVVQLVDYLLEEALRVGASDIHIEPQRRALRVRLRIDGCLETLHRLPPGLHRAVCSRLKVLGGLDIGESRKPQDGRFIVTEGIETRVSTLPSVLGEKVVLRILDRKGVDLDAGSLGMVHANLRRFRDGYTAPNGLVLLTGPTGSGKTTTLYFAMKELNSEDCNLITVEDPVEYELPGATQVQMDAKAERTFAKALRSMLRQDPDVIMVGEIRDAETAAIAVQAALTGHMVLSTLHTNDAVAAVHRLLDMGVEPYLLGPALRCVVGQRLVPRICPECAVPAAPGAEVLAAFGLDPAQPPAGLRRGSGCKACRGKGRRGRLALHEVMPVTAALGRAIARRADEGELIAEATAAGYQPLIVDGLEKARAGLVTLEDVLAVARPE
jgi:type IV pilus assembly protein PilB